MYIYHTLINTLSAHVIHINLNILYTRRAQSYQNNLHKVLYGNTHARAHADCSKKLGSDISWGGNTVRRGRFSVWL